MPPPKLTRALSSEDVETLNQAKQLESLASHLVRSGPYKSMPCSRRIRVLFAGHWIADTSSAMYIWERSPGNYPFLYLPRQAINAQMDQLLGHKGSYELLALSIGDCTAMIPPVLAFDASLQHSDLAGLVKIQFGAAEWFVEDEPIYVHPKDPFKRIDVYPAHSRSLKVSLQNVTLADSPGCVLLEETGLPTRYYVPKTTCNWKVLSESSQKLRTKCPYKGEAQYYDALLSDGHKVDNVAWWYQYPTKESLDIAGLVCFYPGLVDIEFDGKPV